MQIKEKIKIIRIGFAIFSLLLMFFFCAKKKNPTTWENPNNPNGQNWHPPRVTAMGDTITGVNDTIMLKAQGFDDNGVIIAYYWALDNINYTEVTSTGFLQTVFPIATTRTVQVKVQDNDGLYSVPTVIQIKVKDKQPLPAYPVDNVQVLGTSFTLCWAPGAYSSRYKLLFDQVDPPLAIVSASITDTCYTVGVITDIDKTYYWQVVGINASGQEAVGVVRRFKVLALPDMKFINGGTFQMGSSIEQPVHSVTVSSFYMDTVEVTQFDFNKILGFNPSFFIGDVKRPVEQVTWFDAVLFCNARSKMEYKDTCYTYTGSRFNGNRCTALDGIGCFFNKRGYRLPTEAEWEYACRSNSVADHYWNTGTVGQYAWYSANSGNTTHPVAMRIPNIWGLYDMNGNVLEWCWDWYENTYSSNGIILNPIGPSSGWQKIIRGGCWLYQADYQRSAYRNSNYPDFEFNVIGFRTVLSAQ